jgi:hypothetical protein
MICSLLILSVTRMPSSVDMKGFCQGVLFRMPMKKGLRRKKNKKVLIHADLC